VSDDLEQVTERARRRGEEWAARLLAPRPGYIDWRAPNRWTFAMFTAALIVAELISRRPPEEFFSSPVAGFLIGSASSLVRALTRLYSAKIEEFVPRTSLEAMRANEQVRSLATAINALAAGGAVAVVVHQMSSSNPDAVIVIAAVGFAVWIHTGARNLLGFLKDQNI